MIIVPDHIPSVEASAMKAPDAIPGSPSVAALALSSELAESRGGTGCGACVEASSGVPAERRGATALADRPAAGSDLGAPSEPVIWFEVEDVLRWFDLSWVTTGIQRVCHELVPEVARLHRAGGRVRVCRQSLFSGHFEEIELADLLAVFEDPPGRYGPPHALAGAAGRPGAWARSVLLLRAAPRLAHWLRLMVPLILRDVCAGRLRQRRFRRRVRAGDIIVCLGGPWLSRNYCRRLAAAKRATGARFAVLIHDIIPLIDWTVLTAGMTTSFARWLHEIVDEADAIFTVSDFTRRGLIQYAAEVGWRLPPVDVLRLGTGFAEVETTVPQPCRPLPEPYVLFVSTIEFRKNHPLLLRVWRRLLDRHAAAEVPTLLLVGRPGWMTEAFFAELAECRYLDGKIVHFADVSDPELREIYRRCLFTLFPSLYEGWGSPVAESLKYGKFCVASDRASLPEVGGEFCDYFDPTDEADALAKIERVLFEPGYLAAREAELRARYRTPSWADCARLLVDTLDIRLPREPAGAP